VLLAKILLQFPNRILAQLKMGQITKRLAVISLCHIQSLIIIAYYCVPKTFCDNKE